MKKQAKFHGFKQVEVAKEIVGHVIAEKKILNNMDEIDEDIEFYENAIRLQKEKNEEEIRRLDREARK